MNHCHHHIRRIHHPLKLNRKSHHSQMVQLHHIHIQDHQSRHHHIHHNHLILHHHLVHLHSLHMNHCHHHIRRIHLQLLIHRTRRHSHFQDSCHHLYWQCHHSCMHQHLYNQILYFEDYQAWGIRRYSKVYPQRLLHLNIHFLRHQIF